MFEHLADGGGVRQAARLVRVNKDTVTLLTLLAGRHAKVVQPMSHSVNVGRDQQRSCPPLAAGSASMGAHHAAIASTFRARNAPMVHWAATRQIDQ